MSENHHKLAATETAWASIERCCEDVISRHKLFDSMLRTFRRIENDLFMTLSGCQFMWKIMFRLHFLSSF